MWWSACARKPAYTSAIRANSRFSSADSESHGLVTSSGGNGWPSGPLRVSGVPIGLIGGSSVSAGTMPICFCRASVCSRIASYPMSKRPLNLSAHSFETWCGACAAPGA